jgi:hypothetical protein
MHVVNNLKSDTNFFNSFERGNSNTTLETVPLPRSFLATNGSDCALSTTVMKSNLDRMNKESVM